MSKLLDSLHNQLQTNYRKEAEDCIKIYNHLKKTTGHVWESHWNMFTYTMFGKFPEGLRVYIPKGLGLSLLNGIKD